MIPSAFASSRSRTWTRLLVAVLFASSLARMSAQIVPGTNVNMVAGQTWPDGDPFLQRQNEPSIAVSSRNVLHLFAGANDYRTVDLPGLPADKPTGDAWLGIFKSFDGGRTWKSTLLPGYPQDSSAHGIASPLKGFDAAADPIVRSGANGLFVYSGIAFQRAAIVGSTAVQASVQDGSRSRERSDESKAGRGARREREERERELKRERERDRERGASARKAGDKGIRKSAAAGRGESRAEKQTESPRTPGRGQPLARLRGGAEEDDDEVEAGGVAGTSSAVFVSTFADLNNRENGDPVSYIRTTLVDHDSGGRFLDKQWTAVDVPRANSQLCVFDAPQETGAPVRQSFSGGRIYVVYTAFSGSGASLKAQILFSYSTDCGVTWSRPRDLTSVSTPDVSGDGVVNTTDLNLIKASFGKRCGDVGFNPQADVNGDCLVDLLDLTVVSRNVGKVFPTARRIPQGATIAIHPLTGAVYVAWREFKTGNLPDAIQFAASTDFGATFSAPRTVATFNPYDQGTTETSFRTSAFPTLAADANRIYLAWSARGFATTRKDPTTGDARIVMSTSSTGAAWTAPKAVDEFGAPGHQIMPALAFGAGKLSLLYYDLREDVSQLFGPFVDELPILTSTPAGLRHTLDARIAQASPAAEPKFSSVRLSEYAFGAPAPGEASERLQFNPPNLPIFRQGSAPFMGDYIDVAVSPTIRGNPDGTWAFNIESGTSAAGHAVWSDNRDVRAGPAGSLANYTPPNSVARQATSVFDPTQAVPACVANLTGTRDQNIYTARFDQGLFAAALGNSKPLSSMARAFALMVENASTGIRSYRLTIPAQPVGGQASFEQFTTPANARTVLDVSVPPHSIVARTAYVTSSDAQARVQIDIAEIEAPGAAGVVTNGLRGSITLNADRSAPAIENPRIDNPAIENADIRTTEVFTPVISSGVSSPAIENPRIDNPAIENPRIDNVAAANPGIVNPAIENPRIDNPAIENPAIENPRIDNADLVNGSISDTTWELKNAGNTAAAYAVKLLLNSPIPAGFKTQLIIHKTYTTPAADGCDLKVHLQNVVVANITTPAFTDPANAGNPAIENPAIENASVALAPNETANVTFRVFDPNKNDQVTFNAAASVTPAAVANAVNTVDAQAGITQPPVAVAVTITTARLNDAVLTPGVAYSQQLTANVAGTWALVSGLLPPGLTLNQATGVISGTPTTTGSFTFVLVFTDLATPAHTATRQFVVRIGDSLALFPTLMDAVFGVPFSGGVPTQGGIGPLTWTITSGSLPPGITLNAADGSITGTASTAVGSFPFTVTVQDSAVPRNSTSRGYTFDVHPPLGNNPTDTTVSLTADQNPVAAGATLTYTLTVGNAGASQSNDVNATQTLPAGVTFLSVNSATGSCARSGSLVTCAFGNLIPSETKSALVQVRAEVGGVTLVSNADVESASPDTNTANNHATRTTGATGAGTRRVWTANAGTNAAISIINPDTNTSIGTINLPAPAYDIAFSPDGTRAYALNLTTNNIAVIDTATGTVFGNIGVTDPVRVEVGVDNTRLYVTNGSSSVSVFDTLTLAPVTTVTVGDSPAGLAVAPNGKRVYVANRNSNSVSVIDTGSNTVVATVNVGFFPVEVALSPNGKRLYVANFFDNSVSVVDTAINAVVTTVDVGNGPQGIALMPDGAHAYIANFNDDTVSVIDTATNVVTATPIVSGSPNGVVASPDGNAVYVTAYNSSAVRVIDPATNTLATSMPTGSLPIAVDYIRSATGPVASAAPSAVTFGTQALGITKSQSVVVTNVGGSGVVVVGNGVLSGPDASEFQVNLSGCASASLGPGVSCTLSVLFAPVTESAKTANLQLSVSPGPSPLQIGLSGTGLSSLHRVIGRVTDAASGVPIANATVNVFNNNGSQIVATASTDLAGTYASPTLADGGYRAKGSSAAYADQLYQNISCALGCTIVAGKGISMPMVSATSVDFALSHLTSIAGTVSAADAVAAANVTVQLYDTIGNLKQQTSTDGSGHYQFTDLVKANYYERTINSVGYVDKAFDDLSCALGCDMRALVPISAPVRATAILSNLPPAVANFFLPLNTPAGSNVATAPPLASGAVPVTITFANVTAAGKTTLAAAPGGPPLPGGYISGTPPIFYDLATTSVFDNASVCVTNTPGTFQNNSAARLLHLVSGVWNDVTTQVNQVTRVVCGSVTNLGSFTVAQSTNFVAFNFSGGVQTWSVPGGVTTVDIDASGASGTSGGGTGGKGGRLQTTLAVTPGETLFVYVGGAGAGGVGGFNGGGQGGSGSSAFGGGGGGASDIRRNPGGLSDRLAVAGGGGGGAGSSCSPQSGGAGGGVTGGTSFKCVTGSGVIAASGGSQTAGGAGGSSLFASAGTSGSLAVGGNGGTGTQGGGGGGAGYFGGGGGGADIGNGGGGGSGFSSGTNTAQTQGFSNGNGQIVITPRP